MYCTNCGKQTAASMKYCSNCGRKIRDPLDEFRYAEKIAKKEYHTQLEAIYYPNKIDSYCLIIQLATACWIACEHKYRLADAFVSLPGCTRNVPLPCAYEKLEIVKEHATRLFERLVNADDY